MLVFVFASMLTWPS